jgi:hypothetical protein
MDNAFKNAVLAALLDAHVNQPFYQTGCAGLPAINVIYAGTVENSPARRLLVDIWVKTAGESWVKHLSGNLHHSFVLEFSRALLLRKCKGEANGTKSLKVRVKDYYEEYPSSKRHKL